MTDTYAGLQYQRSPIPAYPAFADHEFSVQLVGVSYQFRMQWNAVGGFWSMSIYDADGTPRIEGRKLVQGWQPVDKIPGARPGDGVLVVDGNAETDVPYEQADLGVAVPLVFVTLVREE
jgi:hypothetical protein